MKSEQGIDVRAAVSNSMKSEQTEQVEDVLNIVLPYIHFYMKNAEKCFKITVTQNYYE